MKLFEYEGPFMQSILFLERLTVLNLIWFLGCLPIATAGASTVGLYYAADRLRLGDVALWKNYRIGWRLHWRQATVVWLLFALVVLAFFYGSFTLAEHAVWGSPAMIVLADIGLVTALLTALWVYPVMINFRGTLPALLGNAFIFAFMYAPLTLAEAGLYGVLFWLLVCHRVIAGLVIVFAGALIACLTLLLDERAFRKYRRTLPD